VREPNRERVPLMWGKMARVFCWEAVREEDMVGLRDVIGAFGWCRRKDDARFKSRVPADC
jgi:hypothetical protein